jgi:hypothetical protein
MLAGIYGLKDDLRHFTARKPILRCGPRPGKVEYLSDFETVF